MARSSHEQRPTTAWAVAQKPRPMPRVVRLGRPANDNSRRPRLWLRMSVVGVAAALALLAAANWSLI